MNYFFDTFDAKAVWLDTAELPNRYADFIHDFSISAPDKDAKLYLSVDTEYAVYINGRFVDCGQYDDYPDHKSYDVLRAGSFLVPGQNRLAVRAYHQGPGSAQYSPGKPLLVYALVCGKETFSSGADCICRESKDYVSGPGVQLVSTQLSFSFEYNAAKDDCWINPGVKPGPEWKSPFIYPEILKAVDFYERPIKKLEFHPAAPSRFYTQGVFLRQGEGNRTLGQKMFGDFLSVRNGKDVFDVSENYHSDRPVLPHDPVTVKAGNPFVYTVFDLGGEEAGFFSMKVNAAEGTIIEAAYGEHLDDLRVRSHVGNRNFCFSYICREGEQEFTHYLKRIAGRYLEIRVHNASSKPVVLRYVGIIPVHYPLEETGLFASPDRLMTRILDVSKRTLRLCMHEHYEDCPWREQGLYAFDSRNQMLAGYYLFDNNAYALANMTLLAEHPIDPGYIRITAPSDTPFTIPYFSLAWIIALKEYVLYSGDLEGARPLFARAEQLVRLMESSMENGLLPAPRGKEYWNFYEWVPGLDGADAPWRGGEQLHKFDAPLNAAYCIALNELAELAGWLNKSEKAAAWRAAYKTVSSAFDKLFWNSAEGVYTSFLEPREPEHYAELTQALAVCAKIPSAEKRRLLLERLSKKDNGLIPSTTSSLIFKYEALLTEADNYAAFVFDDIFEKWGGMLYGGATSFWETIKGADDFGGGGSLCHGWTSIPAYFFFAYILGIKPLKPGFAEYAVSPVKLPFEAEGSVLTPRGRIGVKVKDGKAAAV